ncbi:SPOR domain-containing protein [Salicola sp. Rm-C-2C1-2]|uniref:SPOR domain-containing protein n=1 Tax=Salicola sp. Rm-C-2C1-2 TaxID=3141321 RepID=UPI0032E3E991
MDGFKQRIIGALIIVCLAVIFLPMLFDEPHQGRQEQILEVPEEPEMQPVQIEEPKEPDVPRSGDAPDIPMADQGVARDEEPAVAQDDPEPAPEVEQEDAGALKGAWLVRLGSFSNRDNALRLRDRLRNQGMEAHSETVDNEKGTFTRVFTGPFLDEQKAKSARDQLEADYDLEPMVVEGRD